MNNAEITGAGPNVFPLESFRRESPAVAEVTPTDAGSGELSDETQSGLQRLAQLIHFEKKKSKNRQDPREKAVQIYESIKNFNKHGEPGQVLDVSI